MSVELEERQKSSANLVGRALLQEILDKVLDVHVLITKKGRKKKLYQKR